MLAMEANFDGLIGPTHNYGGLSQGNLASDKNRDRMSYPRAAALQGLEKMRLMRRHGLWQGILPPHQRPYLPYLKALGFRGSDVEIFEAVWKYSPILGRQLMSASNMWAANAATVSPSFDTIDGKLHLTPANLSTMLHRSIESEQTRCSLVKAFPFAQVHDPLPAHSVFADEGAANHVRLCETRGELGLELFVYGRDGFDAPKAGFPARQTLQSVQAIARNHSLDPERTVTALQSETAIAAGAFHNDVVCVGALNTLFYHEHAFADIPTLKADIRRAAKGVFEPVFVEVPNAEVPLDEAITSYLFNSMLVKFPDAQRLTLIAPLETQDMASSREYCERLIAGNGPIGDVKYVDVRQSMQNGGGPACLRLRVTLSEDEWQSVPTGMKAGDSQIDTLRAWVGRHYRETLTPDDLRDPNLMGESFSALDELTQIMGLGDDFYPFQRA